MEETNIAVEKNTLKKLAETGQSPWYDNIERRLINNGILKKLFDHGILGVTSNPSIFEKAISGSDEYDKKIKELTRAGKSTEEIYDHLTVKDVSMAADLLTETYEKTQGLDGYVSIEVFPKFAHDTEKTIEYARRIFDWINKPNIMIKIPGTKEAPEAITTLIKEGININVTLLFSESHYETAAKAYIEGLKERAKLNLSLGNVRSVASVFVSRIDTKIDGIVQSKALKGRSAVANMKMIYQKFKKIFSAEDFRALAAGGAHLQRPLWASTSTKNPAYRDVKYVEELIGPDTINTMPPATVRAFLDHGKTEITIEKNLDSERAGLRQLKSLGIDLGAVCQEIQDAGVKAFQASFDKLIQSIEKKAHS